MKFIIILLRLAAKKSRDLRVPWEYPWTLEFNWLNFFFHEASTKKRLKKVNIATVLRFFDPTIILESGAKFCQDQILTYCVQCLCYTLPIGQKQCYIFFLFFPMYSLQMFASYGSICPPPPSPIYELHRNPQY